MPLKLASQRRETEVDCNYEKSLTERMWEKAASATAERVEREGGQQVPVSVLKAAVREGLAKG